jgi:hypothetical protein
MAEKRDVRKELEELRIISIEGSGLMTEKSVFAAIDAIKASNGMRNEESEWAHIKDLQKKTAFRMQNAVNG